MALPYLWTHDYSSEGPRNAYHIERLLLQFVKRGGNLRELLDGMAVVTSDGEPTHMAAISGVGSCDGNKLIVQPRDLQGFEKFCDRIGGIARR